MGIEKVKIKAFAFVLSLELELCWPPPHPLNIALESPVPTPNNQENIKFTVLAEAYPSKTKLIRGCKSKIKQGISMGKLDL